ncbi:MAG: type secretion system protein GspJ [Verrucomicrobiaceae bacterium]|nr:type secretion system protein GspJ [Verrucomicrobiaceae bacterium]
MILVNRISNRTRSAFAPFNKRGSSQCERGIFHRRVNPPLPPFVKGGGCSAVSKNNARGFTLIEVLLAMVITAMVAVMGYAGLTTAMNAAQRHGDMVRRLGEVQTGVGWIVRDLRQSVDRPIIDARGDQQPALIATEDNEQLLELTHTGWDNPRGQRRGSLQRVRYRLDADGNLWRDYWLVLDRIDEEDHLQHIKLLSGVQSFKLQFLDGQSANAKQETLGGEWLDRWPLPPSDTLLPLAVQFDIDIEGIGIVHRIVGLANDQKPQ